jgi:nitric oxide reductase NorD protein
VTSAADTGFQDFQLLATYLAGRSLAVTASHARELAYTDGQHVFVSGDAVIGERRREVVCQSALLGAGSLEPKFVKALRGRPKIARRYLALEGRRVLNDLGQRAPIVSRLGAAGEPTTASAAESLAVATGPTEVDNAPKWFGTIRPGRLLHATASIGARPTDKDLRRALTSSKTAEEQEEEEYDEEPGEPSKILKLFRSPLGSRSVSDILTRLLGMSRSPGESTDGGEGSVRSIRRVSSVGPNARPLPVPLHFVDAESAGAVVGVGGGLYPEWDVHQQRYRPDYCRVYDFPTGLAPDVTAASVEHDSMLRARLARVGLEPKYLRGRPDGDDLDVDALVDLAVDIRAGHAPLERIYIERRKLARNLGVLILLDASGSATDTDTDGRSVHEHQRSAAATLTLTLEELGDRVAVYGFRSRGRSAVHLLALKRFGQRFSAERRAELNRLEPMGYTRLGAAIRHAGELLNDQAGTPHRLLLVLSDGFPYDYGYESRYAEADVHQALAELRAEGIACLCLSIGSATSLETLDRAFGSASHASAATLAELSPRMDDLFLDALRELTVTQTRPRPLGP